MAEGETLIDATSAANSGVGRSATKQARRRRVMAESLKAGLFLGPRASRPLSACCRKTNVRFARGWEQRAGGTPAVPGKSLRRRDHIQRRFDVAALHANVRLLRVGRDRRGELYLILA